MDEKWTKMNSILYHKIKQYNRDHSECPYNIKQFDQKKKKLLQQIQEKVHKSCYVFVRKIHESHKICEKEDSILAQQLSSKTYNLYSQNIPHERSKDLRHSSIYHLNKNNSKNSFLVRKNIRVQQTKIQQKRKGHSQASLTSASHFIQNFSRLSQDGQKGQLLCNSHKKSKFMSFKNKSLKNSQSEQNLLNEMEQTKNNIFKQESNSNALNKSRQISRNKSIVPLPQIHNKKSKFAGQKRYRKTQTHQNVNEYL